MTKANLSLTAVLLLLLITLATLFLLGRGEPKPISPIEIRPPLTRFVHLVHTQWQLNWAIQLPETISSRDFLFLHPTILHPPWQQADDDSWSYLWRGTPEYYATVKRGSKPYALGLRVLARIEPMATGARLSLTLTNESTDTFHDVTSDGGCLQSRSPQFRKGNEVARTHIMLQGRMRSLADLDCTSEVRCHYSTAFKATKVVLPPQGYWGTSSDTVDSPVIIGAVSKKGNKVVALGYQGSWSALQNADAHHCIHSNPYFGDLGPGESVTRKGFVLFGEDMDHVAADLLRLLKLEEG